MHKKVDDAKAGMEQEIGQMKADYEDQVSKSNAEAARL